MTRTIALSLACTMWSGSAWAAAGSLRVVLPRDAGPVMRNIARVFEREVASRCGAKFVASGQAGLRVELAVEPGIGAEAFTIADGKNGAVRIIGNDERGVLYGVGKFLRASRYQQDGFVPAAWRGTSVPGKPVRGIYFATHFHNFYHEAPIEDVERYVEQLGLWGYNTLMVWYDMHHFNGFLDPDAVAFRVRLRRILLAARNIGLSTSLVVIANEAYNNSPAELRADPLDHPRGGFYDVDVCPSRPGGMDYILKVMGELFDWAADLRPQYLCVNPYDQGGCGCPLCRPWGTNGFLRSARAISELAKTRLPGVKVILSTWFMDNADWNGLQTLFAARPGWMNAVLVEPPRNRSFTGDFPVVGFPEISMWGMNPWGGYGATPLPMHHQRLWRAEAGSCEGGFAYSEGIYEDINKVLYSQFYWQSAREATDILDEYIAYEFSPEVIADVREAILLLEKDHKAPDPALALRADTLFARAEAALPEGARKSWRWRILRLRATIDRHGRTLQNGTLAREFSELTALYHAEKAGPGLAPPRARDTRR